MELHEMKQAWQQISGELDALRSGYSDLRIEVKKEGIARSLSTTSVLIGFETVMSGLWLLLLGIFVARQDSWRSMIPALIVYPAAIVSFASRVLQVVMLVRLDYGSEVLAIQTKLERLYMLRMRTVQTDLLLGWLLWVPSVIVVMHFVGWAVPYSVGWPSLAAGIAFGAVTVPVLWWLARHFGSEFNRSAIGRYLLASVTGFGLAEARRRVAVMARFADERD